jgi:hypothetical protein
MATRGAYQGRGRARKPRRGVRRRPATEANDLAEPVVSVDQEKADDAVADALDDSGSEQAEQGPGDTSASHGSQVAEEIPEEEEASGGQLALTGC